MKRGATLLGISFLVSKGLGLFRDNLLASKFGALNAESAVFNLDTYYAAFRIPDLIFNLLAFGILSAGFVPLFLDIRHSKGNRDAFEFANQVLISGMCAIALVSIVCMIAAPLLVRIIVPGFSPEALEVSIFATRLMLISPILFTAAAVASGINNAVRNYIPLAIAPIFYNLGIIFGIEFLAENHGVYGVSLGVIIGALMHAGVHLPYAIGAGMRPSFSLPRLSANVRRLFLISYPRIWGISLQQVGLIISTSIASILAVGSVTIYNFSLNIASLPVGVIGISSAMVSFVVLSDLAARADRSEFVFELRRTLTGILSLLIPLSAGLFLVRGDLVDLILKSGKFGSLDAASAEYTIAFLTIGIIFEGSLYLLARSFYALKNTWIPVVASSIAIFMHTAISLFFTFILKWGTPGLALAQSIAHVVNASILFIVLTTRFQAPLIVLNEFLKFLIATLIMSASIIILQQISPPVLSAETLPVLVLRLMGTTIFGAGIYLGILRFTKSKILVFHRKV